MLADSLPDDFGNALTTAYLANQGVRAATSPRSTDWRTSEVAGVGALEFHPHARTADSQGDRDRTCRAGRCRRSTVAGHIDSERELTEALSHLIAVGTSAGGARAKAVVALNPGDRRTAIGAVRRPTPASSSGC